MTPSLRVNTATPEHFKSGPILYVNEQGEVIPKPPSPSKFSASMPAAIAPLTPVRAQTIREYAYNLDTAHPMELCLTVQQEEMIENALAQCQTPAQKEALAQQIIRDANGNSNNLTFFQNEALLSIIRAYADDLIQKEGLAFAIFKQANGDPRNLTFVQYHAFPIFQEDDRAINNLATHLKTNDTFVSTILKQCEDDLNNLTFIEQEAFHRMGGSLRMLDISGLSLTVDDARTLSQYFPNVRALLARNSDFNEDHLQQLGGLERLKILDLENCPLIRDVALQKLKGFTELTELNLSGCRQITNEGVISLIALPEIEKLGLSGCNKLTDDGIVPLFEAIFLGENGGKLKKLRLITLEDCPNVTKEPIELLEQVPGLEVIR